MSQRKTRADLQTRPLVNPFRELEQFAWEKVYKPEEERSTQRNGRPRLMAEAIPDFQDRERQLRQLRDAAMAAWRRTGFSSSEVERRVTRLHEACMRVLRWEFPNLWLSRQRQSELGEYLIAQQNRLGKAIPPVQALAACFDGAGYDEAGAEQGQAAGIDCANPVSCLIAAAEQIISETEADYRAGRRGPRQRPDAAERMRQLKPMADQAVTSIQGAVLLSFREAEQRVNGLTTPCANLLSWIPDLARVGHPDYLLDKGEAIRELDGAQLSGLVHACRKAIADLQTLAASLPGQAPGTDTDRDQAGTGQAEGAGNRGKRTKPIPKDEATDVSAAKETPLPLLQF